MSLEQIEKSLNNSKEKLEGINNDYTELTKRLSLLDVRAKEYYYDTIDPLEREYMMYNDKYQFLISKFSLAYLEMSEWYVGDYLPYNIFIREIKGVNTYLDSKEDVKELYRLFICLFLFELSVCKV
jgi:hypothetical protein|tara:strand:+ start:3266 stop:3643 length:378 start_codon:yes stop_codon:yes gene_type:complete